MKEDILIESKRGGGGHIAIKQLEYDSSSKREKLNKWKYWRFNDIS